MSELPGSEASAARADQRKQITNSVTYLVPVVIGNLVPLLTLPLFSRLLTPEDFGAWALASSYAIVVGGLAAVGLQTTFERNYFEFRKLGQEAELLYSVVLFVIVTYLIGAVLTWLVRDRVTAWLIGDLAYSRVLFWSFVLTAVVGVKAFYMTSLKNAEQAAAFAGYSLAERLLTAVFQVVLIAWVGAGVMGLVIGQLAAAALVLVLVAAKTWGRLPPAFARAPLLDSLKLGVPLIPRILLVSVGNNADKLLLSQVATLGGVGIYSVGQRIASIVFTYMTALQNVFNPRVYQMMFAGGADVAERVGAYLTPFAYVSTVVAFLIAVFSEEILALAAPSSFAAAVPIVTILSVHMGIIFFGKLPQIQFARRMYWIPILTFASTVLNLACGIVGIWLFGTVGAAWGALAAGAVYTLLNVIVGQRCFRIGWQTGPLSLIFGTLAFGSFGVLALRAFGTPYLAVLATKLVFLGAFVWVGWHIRVITPDTLRLMWSLIPRRLKAA